MGSFSVVQGAALARSYAALVLGRDLAQPPVVTASSPAGTAGVRATLEPLALSAALSAQLSARRLRALLLRARDLTPGAPYRFSVDAGPGAHAALTTWTLPEALPAEGLSCAVATCFYNGFGMSAKLRAALAGARLVTAPAFEIWAGDNVYLDVRDFDGANPNHARAQTLARYLEYFGSGDYALARGARPSFTAYDDHELWNNYPERQLWLARSWDGNADAYGRAAQECLTLFQSALNPAPVVPKGRSYRFDVAPLSFFVADLRTQRTRKASGDFRMMPKAELRALVDWASGLTGPGVLVVGQPLWTGAGNWTDYNPPAFVPEYQAIWRALRDAPYDVLIVSGDVHHSRLLRVGLGADRFAYEFVTSPVCHIPGVLATAGFGNSQARAKVSPPARAENVGFPVSAEYYFGTSAPNSFGLLRFVPKPDGAVAVGAAFVDYAGQAPVYPPSEPANLPRLGLQGKPCVAEELFTLRRR